MTGSAAQQFICGAGAFIGTMVFLVIGFKVLHGPDYRKDAPPKDEK